MNKKLMLIFLSMSFILQSCAIVHIADPSKKNSIQDQALTEPSPTDSSIAGDAYRGSYKAVMLAGLYGHGSSTWNDEYEEWLNGDSEESPDKFNDIDGVAYHESVKAAEDGAL